MQVKSLAANQTEITLRHGTRVLVSYETPVAAQLFNGTYCRTDHKWSVTTTRHINKWLNGANAETRPQTFFDNLLIERG